VTLDARRILAATMATFDPTDPRQLAGRLLGASPDELPALRRAMFAGRAEAPTEAQLHAAWTLLQLVDRTLREGDSRAWDVLAALAPAAPPKRPGRTLEPNAKLGMTAPGSAVPTLAPVTPFAPRAPARPPLGSSAPEPRGLGSSAPEPRGLEPVAALSVTAQARIEKALPFRAQAPAPQPALASSAPAPRGLEPAGAARNEPPAKVRVDPAAPAETKPPVRPTAPARPEWLGELEDAPGGGNAK
jgi:hypothetical protein